MSETLGYGNSYSGVPYGSNQVSIPSLYQPFMNVGWTWSGDCVNKWNKLLKVPLLSPTLGATSWHMYWGQVHEAAARVAIVQRIDGFNWKHDRRTGQTDLPVRWSRRKSNRCRRGNTEAEFSVERVVGKLNRCRCVPSEFNDAKISPFTLDEVFPGKVDHRIAPLFHHRDSSH